MYKNTYPASFTTLIAIVSFALISSCKKSDPIVTPDPIVPPVVIPVVPIITATAPLAALPNSTFTITGRNFPTDVSKITINFGTISAAIASATATEIVVHIPASAKSGPIIAILNGSALVAKTSFTILGGTQGINDYYNYEEQLALDKAGNLYTAAFSAIYKTTPAGVRTLFAGAALAANSPFKFISGMVFNAAGDMFVADNGKSQLFKVTPAGVVSAFAGSGTSGFADGQGTAAQTQSPYGLVIDVTGNLYTSSSSALRKISPAGLVSTLAGGPIGGYVDGPGSAAKLGACYGLVIDNDNNILMSDISNHVIRKVTQAGVVSTFAGTGVDGWADGTVKTAQFRWIEGLAFNANGDLFVCDNFYTTGRASRIRMINKAGLVTTFLSGDFSTPHVLTGPLNVATTMFPTSIVFSAAGDMYIANSGDAGHNVITFK